MPQGGIDGGEDPATAALRELAEETGIRAGVDVLAETAGWLRYDLPDHLIGKAWGGKYRGQQQKWFAIRFLGRDDDIDINPPDPDKVEFEAWKWVPLAEVTGLIVPFKRDVYRQVVGGICALRSASCRRERAKPLSRHQISSQIDTRRLNFSANLCFDSSCG